MATRLEHPEHLRCNFPFCGFTKDRTENRKLMYKVEGFISVTQPGCAADFQRGSRQNPSGLLDAARDPDQIKRAVEQLRRFGQTVDIARHFGFVQTWKIVGPLDNRGGRGYAAALAPEDKLDFSADYAGIDGQVGWRDFTTHDDYGQVDLNAALGRHLEALAYAAAEFQAAATREVEIRVGSENACRVWLNGRLLIESPTYHSLAAMDQFVGRGTLRAGRNSILVKVCQNGQTEDWARAWQFQLRVCDATGNAILSTDRPLTGQEGER